MELKELTRFNHIIETGGHCYWDIYAFIQEEIRTAAKDNSSIRSIGIDTWGGFRIRGKTESYSAILIATATSHNRCT